ncbi:MAG: pyrroline-5-carboxylate reductase [Caloramator sp.]|nr:pyrroline-5-carboxylate reductase [Caloramator sp.]
MIGLIGCGNMGGAILKGIIKSGYNPKDIYAYDHNKEKILNINSKVNICNNENEVINNSKYIFLAVKPLVYDTLLNNIKDAVDENKVIISMAAGYEIEKIEEKLSKEAKVVRIMPNTPSLIGEGYTVAVFNKNIDKDEEEYVVNLLKSLGEVKIINESLINAYSAVTGSGPAFVFLFIEAMADAAVLLGIPRKDAYEAAAKTLIGSSKLLIETEKHPGELKDMVTSPAGTTIEGIRTLEEKGFRSAIIECIINTYKKNLNLKNIR